MSEIVGYETDVTLEEEDKRLRILVVDDICHFYLDEILIFSGGWEDNLRHLFLHIKRELDP